MESTTSLFSREDMVRKVAGLLETAESFAEQGNDEAAQAYVQKAHTLQQKYSIDQAMLAERTGKKVEKIINKKVRMPGKWGKRKVALAHTIANRTGCTGYYSRGVSYIDNELHPRHGLIDRDAPKIYYYNIFGFEQDVEHVEFMINSLSHQLDTSLEIAKKDKPFWEHGRAFSASFCMGFTSVIGNRLHAAQREAQTSVEAVQSNGLHSVALVLASKKQQVEAEMTATVGRLGKGTASEANSHSGYIAGRDAGNRATIAKGAVSGGSKGSLGR